MGRTHDVVISGFDLDALERERDEAQERADTMFAKHAEILDQYRRERDAERALADRLAEGLRKMVLYSEALISRIQDRSDINFKTLNEGIDLFNEWKEARSEI